MAATAATGCEASVLESVLREGDLSSLLIVDCRPFLVFNASHITHAHNVHCPPIVKRRSGGSLPLENIVRCAATRSRLLAGHYTQVVLYDDDTESLDRLQADSNLALVLKSLAEDDNNLCYEIFFLEGGFVRFSRLFPWLCEGAESSSSLDSGPSLSSSTASSSLALSMSSSSTGTSAGTSPLVPASAAVTAGDTVRVMTDQGDPVEILPFLFLGNAYHAGQEARLRQIGISALLNVSTSQDVATPSPGFCYRRLLVDDNCMSDISCWFPEAIHYIEGVRERGEKLLVHCHAGISRSATICLAYLMWSKQWSLEFSYDFLKSKRRLIAPNLNFMRQLLEFEQELTHNRPGGATSSALTTGLTSTGVTAPALMVTSPGAAVLREPPRRFSFSDPTLTVSASASRTFTTSGGYLTTTPSPLVGPRSAQYPACGAVSSPAVTVDNNKPASARPASFSRPLISPAPTAACCSQLQAAAGVFSFPDPASSAGILQPPCSTPSPPQPASLVAVCCPSPLLSPG